MIKDYILGIPRTPDKYFGGCSCKDVKKTLRALPFDAEIYGKLELRVICDDCYERNADDI